MKRRCSLYKSSEQYARHVYLDEQYAKEILDFIEDEKIGKKFDYVVNRILEQQFITYDDFVRLAGYDHLAEIRIFPNGVNARIYCKEITQENGTHFIIAVKLLPKKASMKITKAMHQMIKPIEGFEYDL